LNPTSVKVGGTEVWEEIEGDMTQEGYFIQFFNI